MTGAVVYELPARAPAVSGPDRYLSVADLAALLQCCTKTVYRMVGEGMPHHTFGRRMLRFRLGEVESWLEGRDAG